MRITQISPSDIDGGAERTALSLHTGFVNRNIDAQFLVGRMVKPQNVPGVSVLGRSVAERARMRVVRSVLGEPKDVSQAKVIEGIATPARIRRWRNKCDDFSFDTARALEEAGALSRDILQYHALFGHYLNLNDVVELSKTHPTVVKVHDDWVLTGKCTSRLGCDRYLDDCRNCERWPDHQSNIAGNFAQKKELWKEARFHVVTPSQWMRDQLQGTIFEPAIISSRVIPNGINIETFQPAKTQADFDGQREQLGIPSDAHVVLCGATSAKSAVKNVAFIAEVLKDINDNGDLRKSLAVVILGGKPDTFDAGSIPVIALPFIDDPAQVAQVIQISDVYVHAAKAEAFGRALVEAQACGVPVVAADVGGVKETFIDNKTGILVPSDERGLMARAIRQLLGDDDLRAQMGKKAREHVVDNLSDGLMTDRYLAYYEEILDG